MAYRYLYPFFSLSISLTLAQAQSTVTLNTINAASTSVVKQAPRRINAVEAPLYVKLYGFYGLLTPGSQVTTSSSSSSAGMATSFKTNSTGLGAGARAGVGIGFIASDFINLGIDADLLFGASLATDNFYKGSNYTYTSTTTTDFRVLSIIPNITFKALSRPAFYIYNRLGLVGGVVLDYSTTQNALNAPTTGVSTTYQYKTNYRSNSLALGYQAALGIQFRLSQSLRGYAEVVGYNQSFQPKEVLYANTSTKSGAVVSTSSNIVQYKKQGEYTTTKQDGIDVSQAASYNIAMNSIGVGVGLLFRF